MTICPSIFPFVKNKRSINQQKLLFFFITTTTRYLNNKLRCDKKAFIYFTKKTFFGMMLLYDIART